MSTDIVSYIPQGMQEIKEFCAMVAKSNIVPKEYIGKPENVFVACLKGMDLGLKPLQALECIAVINGKTSLYGDAYLAVARGSGKVESYNEQVTGEGMAMKAVVTVKRKGEDAVTGEFTANDAKTAGLWGKGGPWTLFPKRMLTMKARNYVLRAVFADLFLGMEYSAEELTEVAEAKQATARPSNSNEPRDITPTTVEATENFVDEIQAQDRTLFKIDGAFVSGIDLNCIVDEKIQEISTKEDMERYEIWKAENKESISRFCADNKQVAMGFAADIKAKRAELMNA